MNLKINRKMLPMKAHYFLFNAGQAPVVPFMPTYARQLGFSSVVVGTIYTILPLVGLIVKPVFGVLADRYQQHKTLVLIFQFITAIAFMAILFIPPIEQVGIVDYHCNDAVSDFRYCPKSPINKTLVDELTGVHNQSEFMICSLECDVREQWMRDAICTEWQKIYATDKGCDRNRSKFKMEANITMNHIEMMSDCLFFEIRVGHLLNDDDVQQPVVCPHRKNKDEFFKSPCNVKCTDDGVMRAIVDTKLDNTKATSLYQFWLLFTFLILSWAGMAVVVSLGDAICFGLLGEKHNLYGNQRLWGAVGWGVFSILAGIMVDEFSKNQITKDYTSVFYLMLVLIVLDMICTSKFEKTKSQRSSSILKDIGVLFLSFPVIVFFTWCIVVGLCTALIWNFLFWHLEVLAENDATQDVVPWMKTLQGLAMGIQCFGGELPFFFLSGWILKKIGHINAMSLVLIGFSVRFLLYSILTNPWWVLPIELMNGVTFGIFYSTMASYASIVAPPGTEATLQGLVGAIFEGVGVSLGSFIGGILIDSVGGSATFRIYSIVAFVFCIVHIIVQKIMEKYFGGGRGINRSAYYSTPTDALTMLDEDDLYYQANT